MPTSKPELPPEHAPHLRLSHKLVTLAGIDVHVHGSFVLLIAFLAVSDLVAGHGVAAMARHTFLILLVFAAVVLHEFGHALTARRFGIRTRDITLFPIGGIARLEGMPEKPGQQLLVAIAGPAVNVVIALLLFAVLRASGSPVGFGNLEYGSGQLLTQLMWINFSLAAFNLLPGYPMDGGRVLRALLAMRMDPERATRLAARVGQSMAGVLAIVGLAFNPFLIVIAAFVWMGATAELSLSTVKAALSGLSVRNAMITEFGKVSATDPLSQAVSLTLAGFQQDFPVMDGDKLVGVLTHGDLLVALAEHGARLPILQAIRSNLETATPSEGLVDALSRMTLAGIRVMPVLADDAVIGLITVGTIKELMALKTTGHQNGLTDGMHWKPQYRK